MPAYLLHLIRDRKLAYASVNQASCALRFLYRRVLGRPEAGFDIPMAKVPKRLPQILSREEVARLIDAARTLRGRTLLMTTYAAGLRVYLSTTSRDLHLARSKRIGNTSPLELLAPLG
ncbi:MAG: phage integrase N-terminal SAM-like domain-containing protein [Accumulibacter sp.]|uniref:phage integrase N-terminal SAM-like domain-containing protein n=1 Tax=Accumulibacter sp. TaxID=2053492 RepID=UPI002FC2C0A2